MKLNVVSLSGEAKSITALANVFDRTYDQGLLHEVIASYRTNGRSGNSAQLSRSDVRGGGAKPWRQKGTGRARAGTSRGPIWRGGGVTFASSKRDYNKKINRKVYRHAMKIIFSELIRKDRLMVIDEIKVEPKTKALIEYMKKLEVTNALFVVEDFDYNLSLAARNLVGADVRAFSELNPLVLLQFKKVCITVKTIHMVEEWLS